MTQSREVSIKVNNLPVKGYFAEAPKSTAGVSVLPAWWGLTPFFMQFCDRLANAGYAAFAPGLHNCQTASTIDEAKRQMTKSDESPGGFVQSVAEASVDQIRLNANLTGGNRNALSNFCMTSSAKHEGKGPALDYLMIDNPTDDEFVLTSA